MFLFQLVYVPRILRLGSFTIIKTFQIKKIKIVNNLNRKESD